MNDDALLDAVVSPIVALTFSAVALFGGRSLDLTNLGLIVTAVLGFAAGWYVSRKISTNA